jgi:hypothetical protein
MHQSQERETKPTTQIPLMGMEKLGTKGPAFIALLQQRTNVLFNILDL